MKSELRIIPCFLLLSSLVFGDDFMPRSPDFEKMKLSASTATVVLVGNDEPWLEIHVPIVESDRDGRKTVGEQGKIVRVPIYRAVAWNTNGERLRDEAISQTFLEPKPVIVDDLIVQSKRATLKRVFINQRVQFGRYDEYRKFQRDGVHDPRVEIKVPPVGSIDTGEYFVSFESTDDKQAGTKAIWLFLPPEVFEEAKSYAFPSDAVMEAAMHSQRLWQDRSGRFKVYAQVSEYDDEIVTLRKADDSMVSIPISKLSTKDQMLINCALRRRLLSSEKSARQVPGK